MYVYVYAIRLYRSHQKLQDIFTGKWIFCSISIIEILKNIISMNLCDWNAKMCFAIQWPELQIYFILLFSFLFVLCAQTFLDCGSDYRYSIDMCVCVFCVVCILPFEIQEFSIFQFCCVYALFRCVNAYLGNCYAFHE